MKLPKDWDKPDKHNNELCRLFQKGTFPCGSFSLPYRFFSPEGRDSGKKLPLAVYLHGADAIGTDNELQLSMHDIGTMLALPSWQERHPCYILAPQYGPGQYWSDDYVKRGLLRLIHALAERPGTDENRIYIYGYSAGGVGTLRLVKENPGLFAAALSICGATNAEGLDELVPHSYASLPAKSVSVYPHSRRLSIQATGNRGASLLPVACSLLPCLSLDGTAKLRDNTTILW